jgi:hypothetical protein
VTFPSFRSFSAPLQLMTALVILWAPGLAFGFSKADVYTHARAGTVLIVAIDDRTNGVSIGSGFVVNANGLIVTNAHVLEDSTRILVYAHTQEVYETPTIVATDPDKDLAAIRVTSSSLRPLRLSDQPIPDGNDTIAVGYPRLTDVLNMGFALHPTVIPGSVSGTVHGRSRTAHRSASFVQVIGHINQGSSGGPLVDVVSGEVAGMVVLQVPYLERARDRKGTGIGSVMIRSGIGYAIPAAVIRRWLTDNNLSPQAEAVASEPVAPGNPLATAETSFATGHLLYTIAQVLPKDPDLYELAVYHYEAALETRPHDPKVLRHVGLAYAALGRFDDAILVMQEALAQVPQSALFAYELGLAQEAKGQGPEALKTWRSFLDGSASSVDPGGWQTRMREAVNRVQGMPLTQAPTATPTSAKIAP